MPTPAASSQTTKSSRNGADLVVEFLSAEGIRFVAGVPGTPTMDLLDNLARQDDIRFIVTRHEQVAGFLAERVSRPGKQLGVCVVSRGPGATNAAIAVENAHHVDSDAVAGWPGGLGGSPIGTPSRRWTWRHSGPSRSGLWRSDTRIASPNFFSARSGRLPPGNQAPSSCRCHSTSCKRPSPTTSTH